MGSNVHGSMHLMSTKKRPHEHGPEGHFLFQTLKPKNESFLIFRLLAFLLAGSSFNYAATVQFIGFTNFAHFQIATQAHGLEITSPPLNPKITWAELIPSWNLVDHNAGLQMDIQLIFPDHRSGWYCLGEWSWNGEEWPRRSRKGQSDQDARVETDTLRAGRAGAMVQFRVLLQGENVDVDALKLIGLCFSEGGGQALLPRETAPIWALDVPEYSQADYPMGIKAWCSPTAMTMILGYWADKLSRPDLTHPVPEVARAVDDPNWPGTGNWPFNTAFAGAHPNMRAYVTRFTELNELEAWISGGFPVACSVSYNRLRGENRGGEGHLIVCVGFDGKGNIIVNDPGRKAVRQIYGLANFLRAWAESKNTVYLVYSKTAKIPPDRLDHWLSK